ncbi:helitron_like_N domain-containing protein [Trichonephila clavata]|uniref:Helitron_like_N domain-containing protein n=1 Tax=Trichonephila clavata TaxID=2740835 RepID=A0A8X6LI22_TRICU|nr:helitron_like_N domain-containing protein [Trichonephila clavata]
MLVVTKQRGGSWVCLCVRDTQQPLILRYICPMVSGFTSLKIILERMATPPKTTLTAFFLLCQNDAFSKTLLYVDVLCMERVVERMEKSFTRNTCRRLARCEGRRCSWAHLHSAS